MITTLNNVKTHLLSMSINVTIEGWETSLSSKLNAYLTYEGWSYYPQTDVLMIQSDNSVPIPNNITDFGEVVSYDNTLG